MLLDIFRRKKNTEHPFGFANLGADIHSHLVPAVDDGSDSVETSLAMIEGLISLGYHKIITTPHIRPDYFPNTREAIEEGFKKLKAAVQEAGLKVDIEVAAEYFVDYEFPKTIDAGNLLTWKDNHLLIEVSTFSPPPNLYDTIFKLRIKGYQPVIAHPERYLYFSKTGDYQKLKDFGCLLQVNLLSLAGNYGKQVKETAHQLVKDRLADFLGSDMHHPGHLETLRHLSASRSIMALLATHQFQNATL